MLLSRGARADCVDRLGRTALSYACEHGHCKLVKLLIDDDYDINMADKEGNTPLFPEKNLSEQEHEPTPNSTHI